MHDRRLAGPRRAEELFGVAHLRAREPLRAWHLTAAQDAVVRSVDLEPIPERAPKSLQVLDRPAPQLVVVGEPARPHEAGHLGGLRVRRDPQKLSLPHGGVILGAPRAPGGGAARPRQAARAASAL